MFLKPSSLGMNVSTRLVGAVALLFCKLASSVILLDCFFLGPINSTGMLPAVQLSIFIGLTSNLGPCLVDTHYGRKHQVNKPNKVCRKRCIGDIFAIIAAHIAVGEGQHLWCDNYCS